MKWIKDADTGELFPVPDDFEYEIPEHLKTAECNHIDYEKTTRTTIDELQSQLTAAQNEIAVIQQEREVTLPSDSENCNDIVTTKRFDFDLSKIIIAIIVTATVIVFAVFAVKLILTNDININTSYSIEQQLSEYQEQEHEDTEQSEDNPYISLVLRLGCVIVPIFGFRFAIKIFRGTINGC